MQSCRYGTGQHVEPENLRTGHLCLALIIAGGQLCSYAAEPTDVARLEKEIQAAYDTVRAAVVKIEIEHDHSGNGVIVTAEGHILITAAIAQNHRNRQIQIQRADGQRMNAELLGWSSEWNIGLLKIASDKPFPHVSLGATVPKAGQECLAIGFPDQPHAGREPLARFGRVAIVGDSTWCTCTCQLWFDSGTGLFDLRGQLLGICTRVPAMSDPTFTLTAPVRDNWQELVAGKNVDEVRLFGKSVPAGPASARNSAPARDLEVANAATVRIRANSGQTWSGVIVTDDGYVATCAHHNRLPGDRVTVLLPDGREAPAEVRGCNRITDLGLVKISTKGPWPFTQMGRSRDIKVDTPATATGFPHAHQEKEPLIRPTQIVPTPGDISVMQSLWLYSKPETSLLTGGDSGGGLFDSSGYLIGIHQGVSPHNSHARIEALRKQWDALVTARADVDSESDRSTRPEAAFFKAADDKVKAATVEILCDDRLACIGFLVSGDGNIVTKYSELRGKVSCRLHSGAKLPARVVRYSREDDLTLLRVETKDVPEIGWSAVDAGRHTFLAAVIPGKAPIVGLVTRLARPIPSEEGMQWPLRDTKDGLAFVETPRESERPLEQNDIIVSVEGHPTPNVKTFSQVMRPSKTTRLAYPGDTVQITVKRGNKLLDLRCVIPSLPSESLQRESNRRSGFTKAVDSDMSLLTTQAGAPAIDGNGDVAGIVIATRGRGQTHILPVSVVRNFLKTP